MITEVFLPQLTSTMEEGTVVNWLKREGEAVEADEPLVEVETDKAIMEIESPASGLVLRILAEEGDTCAVLAPLALIGEAGDDAGSYQPSAAAVPQVAAAEPAAAAAPTPVAAKMAGRLAVSPRARRLAEELGVDLGAVSGSGPEGRIVEEDVRRAAAASPAQAGPAPVVAFSGMRKAVAANLSRRASGRFPISMSPPR